jgi:hypothetical protein
MPFELFVERTPRHTEALGRAFDASIFLCEDMLDMLALNFDQRQIRICVTGSTTCTTVEMKVLEAESFLLTE